MPLRAIGAPLPFTVGDGAADHRTARRRIRPASGYRLRPGARRGARCDLARIRRRRPDQCPSSCFAAPIEAALAASSVFKVLVTITSRRPETATTTVVAEPPDASPVPTEPAPTFGSNGVPAPVTGSRLRATALASAAALGNWITS